MLVLRMVCVLKYKTGIDLTIQQHHDDEERKNGSRKCNQFKDDGEKTKKMMQQKQTPT